MFIIDTQPYAADLCPSVHKQLYAVESRIVSILSHTQWLFSGRGSSPDIPPSRASEHARAGETDNREGAARAPLRPPRNQMPDEDRGFALSQYGQPFDERDRLFESLSRRITKKDISVYKKRYTKKRRTKHCICAFADVNYEQLRIGHLAVPVRFLRALSRKTMTSQSRVAPPPPPVDLVSLSHFCGAPSF